MLHYEGSHLLKLVGIVPSITGFILFFFFLKALVNGKQNLWANQGRWENLGFSLVISILKSQLSHCWSLYPCVRHTLVYTRIVCEGNKRKDTENSILSCHLMPWEKDYVEFIWCFSDHEACFAALPSFSTRKHTTWSLCPQASLRQPRDHKTQSVGHCGTCFTLLIVRSEEMMLLKSCHELMTHKERLNPLASGNWALCRRRLVTKCLALPS